MGLEGKVVRRLRFDGSRYDMDIMSDQGGGNGDLCDSDIIVDDKVSPSYEYQYGRKKIDHEIPLDGTWQSLTEENQFEDFHTSIMGDPSRRRHLLPAAIQKSKLSYLFSEIVDDLYPGGRVKLWTFDFYQSFILFFMAYWAVLYMHYMSQYLFLLSLSTP